MPNWVTCQVNIHHNDKRMIDRIATIHSQEWDLLQTIYPCPKALVDTIAGSGGGVEVEIAREKQYELNTKVYGYKHWYDCVLLIGELNGELILNISIGLIITM